jgi:hypothetical protein
LGNTTNNNDDSNGQLRCSTTSNKLLEISLNNNWVLFKTCADNEVCLDSKFGYPICATKNVCKSEYLYANGNDQVYKCSYGEYKANSFKGICFQINNECSNESFTSDNGFINTYSKYNKNHCYKSETKTYSFNDGSSVCVINAESQTFDIYQCGEGEHAWNKTQSGCTYCIQNMIDEGTWTNIFDKRHNYTLNAYCIQSEYPDIGFHCADNTIIYKTALNNSFEVADCSTIGRKCDESTPGVPKCI